MSLLSGYRLRNRDIFVPSWLNVQKSRGIETILVYHLKRLGDQRVYFNLISS